MAKITDEETFFRHFFQNANEFGEVDIDKAFPNEIISPYDLHEYIDIFTKKGYIKFNDFQHYSITQLGRQSYVPVHEKISKPIIHGIKITLKHVIIFLTGIASAIVIAIALHWLGLD